MRSICRNSCITCRDCSAEAHARITALYVCTVGSTPPTCEEEMGIRGQKLRRIARAKIA